MARTSKRTGSKEKRITRYTFDDFQESRIPETGHTALLPVDEQMVTVPMDNGWSKAVKVGKLPEGDERPAVVDIDPVADPVLFWAGKRNRRQVPILPLQRNEVVSESHLAQIIGRARKAAAEKTPQLSFDGAFAEVEKVFRESDKSKRVEFYTHDEGWKNKLICGDSLHVMESLLHYEGLRGKVQMIYVDPPYGIAYNSNFQQRLDTTANDEEDQADDVLSIKAFRDTWTLGIHSYLTYLQERLYLCRELLADTGSVFVQISEDNVHLVRQLLDEVFGRINAFTTIVYQKTALTSDDSLGTIFDYVLWYAKDKQSALLRYNQLYRPKLKEELAGNSYGCIESSDGSEWRRMTSDEKAGITKIRQKVGEFLTSATLPHRTTAYPSQLCSKEKSILQETATGLRPLRACMV